MVLGCGFVVLERRQGRAVFAQCTDRLNSFVQVAQYQALVTSMRTARPCSSYRAIHSPGMVHLVTMITVKANG